MERHSGSRLPLARGRIAGFIPRTPARLVGDDCPVDPKSSRNRVRLDRTFDWLDHYKWWLSGILAVGVVIWADPADRRSPMAWVVFILCLILLWIPGFVRLGRGIRRTSNAFKDGLDGR